MLLIILSNLFEELFSKMYRYFFIGVIILICIYYYYIIRSLLRREKWVSIGTLRQIFIYPVEGGPGKSVQQALCLKTGLQNVQNDIKDRSFIVTQDGSAILYLQNHGMATRDLSMMLEDSYRDAINKFKYTTKKINYLGDLITVKELHSDAIQDNFVKSILNNLTEEFKICYFSPTDRRYFVKKVKKTLKTENNSPIDEFSPNYSSYTLINTKSLEELRKLTGVESLSPENFRSHLVIEGSYPYCEDSYTHIRIGNVDFKDAVPCTHTPFINSSSFKSPDNLEPYTTLLRTRILSSLRPDLSNSISPVFGINLELTPTRNNLSTISVGDKVYAKIK